jgi:uncharacterized SAM-binding protein YcdF (DUF218 family)
MKHIPGASDLRSSTWPLSGDRVLHRKYASIRYDKTVPLAGWLSRLWWWTIYGCAGLGALLVVVSSTPLVSWWATKLAEQWNDPEGEVLIVLGGSILDGGIVGETSYWRSVYGVLAFKNRGFRQVLLSGGPADTTSTPVSQPMKQFMECLGVPAGVIQMETESGSTRENAIHSARLLAHVPGRKVLLTSDFHMFRARRAFAKAGMDVAPSPFPDVIKRSRRWPARWGCFLDLAGETAKIGYYFIRGWI